MGIFSIGRLATPDWVSESVADRVAKREDEREKRKKDEGQKTAAPEASAIQTAEIIRTKDAITRVAEYVCSIPARPGRYIARTDIEIGGNPAFTDQKNAPVSIRIVPNESPQQTEDRFEEAAEIERRGLIFTRKMSGCYDFKRFLETPEMALNGKKIDDEIKRGWDAYSRAEDLCVKNGGGVRCYR